MLGIEYKSDPYTFLKLNSTVVRNNYKKFAKMLAVLFIFYILQTQKRILFEESKGQIISKGLFGILNSPK